MRGAFAGWRRFSPTRAGRCWSSSCSRWRRGCWRAGSSPGAWPGRSSELTQAMAVVGGGDLDHPIQATSRDEIGDLARALARMTGQLRTRASQLVQAGEARLDRRDVGGGGARAPESAREPARGRPARAPASRRRPPPPSTSTRSSRRWIASTAASATCSASAAQRRFTPSRRACRAWSTSCCPPSPADAGAARRSGDGGPGRPASVRVDPMQLEQAILEIVSNALDAMPAGGRLGSGRSWPTGPARRTVRGHRGQRHRRRHPRAESCRPSASRSSRPGRKAPGSASPSPSATSSRTAACWRSRAGRARARPSASASPTERGA